MKKLNLSEKIISDFIYKHPDVVVVVLNENGYPIDMETATLSQITDLTFKAITLDSNEQFGKALDSAIANDGYSGFVMIAVAVVSSLVSGFMAQDSAKKARELERQKTLSNLANQASLSMEQLRMQAETDRTKILANSIGEYNKTLQTESTARLSDTWLYVFALGAGIGIIYGIKLISSKN